MRRYFNEGWNALARLVDRQARRFEASKLAAMAVGLHSMKIMCDSRVFLARAYVRRGIGRYGNENGSSH